MSVPLTVTILGCGSSSGVPRIGNHWGVCDPTEPRNRRRRCSLLIQRGHPGATTDVLIDTSPDLRDQFLDANQGRVDAVLFTHDHADQAHGIDDLRSLAMNMRRRVDVYMDEPTAETLMVRFGYCFATPEGSAYPPILNAHLIRRPFRPFSVTGPGGALEVVPFEQNHGQTRSLGFRMGPFAYSNDVVELPEAAFAALSGIECWVVDALRYAPHPSHSHVAQTLTWIERLRPGRSVLTNLHIDLDYQTLKRELPPGVEPAFDGMRLELALGD